MYVQNGVLNRGGTYTVSDGKQTLTQTNVTFEPFTGVYKPGAEGNYLVFEGLSGNSLTIEAMATPDPEVGTGFRGPINAVEICAAGACVALPNAVAGRGVIGNHPVAGKRENLVFGPAEDQGPRTGTRVVRRGQPGKQTSDR